MATTIGLTVNALEWINQLDDFDGAIEVYDEEYRVTVEYSLDNVKVKKVEKRYYNEFREVSEIDPLINVDLFLSTFSQMLRERKRIFNIEEYERKMCEDEEKNREYQDRLTNYAGTMAGY